MGIPVRVGTLRLHDVPVLSGRKAMNRWRWLGISIFLIGAVALVAPPLSVFAQDKGAKDKAAQTDKDKAAQADKDKGADKGGKGDAETLAFTAFKKGSPPFYQELKTKTEQQM